MSSPEQPRPHSPLIHIPKIHQPKHSFVNPKLMSRFSLIPKFNIEKTFDEYHKQNITNFSKNIDTSSSESHFKGKKQSKSPLKGNTTTDIVRDLSTIYSLNEQDLFTLALETLQKPFEFRDNFDIKLICLSTENVKFFQGYDSQTHAECCRYLMRENGKSGSTLFEIGSIGTKFYVILQGSVGIWVNLPKIILDENGKPLEQKELVLTEVKTLGPGTSFGELALLDNRPRAATIRCKENCEFAVLDKQHFDAILKEKEQRKLFENIDFLSSMRVFHGIGFSGLKSLFYHCEEMKALRKQIIYKQGDNADSVYIIREGEFLMTLDVEIFVEGLRTEKVIKTMDLTILNSGNLFGEEEIMEKTKRKFAVICVSHSAILYVLSKKEFYRRVFLEDYSRIFLKENLKIKKNSREQRIKDFIETEKMFLLPKGQDFLNCDNTDEKNEEFLNKNEGNTSENGRVFSGRISKKKTLIEQMKKTFVLAEAVKASAYEKYKAIKAKYPNPKSCIDIQEIIRKKILDEAEMTPYLRAVLKQKTGNMELKRKLENKENKRKFALFFQEQQHKERKAGEKERNFSLFTSIHEESKGDNSIFGALSDVKAEKRMKDPFRKIKSISLHEKNEKKRKNNSNEFFPLKYQVQNIIQKKPKRTLPVPSGHLRGFSL